MCVPCPHGNPPRWRETLHVKDILTELSKLFTGVIDTVKEQCDLKTPLEDKIRVMINSKSLKSPISTRLLPAIQMTSTKFLPRCQKCRKAMRIYLWTSRSLLMW